MTADTPDVMIDWLSKALELQPNHYAARQARVLAYYGLKDYTRMVRDGEVIAVIRPKDPLGYCLLAIAEREIGDLDAALRDHDRAIGLSRADRELAELYCQRQETEWRAKDYSTALRDARRSVILDPNSSVYAIALGRALFKVGEYEGAKQEFRRVWQAGESARCQALAEMVRYAVDAAAEGTPLEIPETIVEEFPFAAMQVQAEWYRELGRKGRRITRDSLGGCSWSPDATQLAYTRFESFLPDNEAPSTGGVRFGAMARGIAILNLPSGRVRVLVANGTAPAWSPDGRYIAFCRTLAFLHEQDDEIWLIPAEGGQPKRLALGGCPSWTDNPKRLYFQSRIDATMCCIDITDPNAEPVKVAKCPGLHPHVSPDERYLAYATVGVLTVVDLATGHEAARWVVPGSERFCFVRWSPDGKEISLGVVGSSAPSSGLWVFNLDLKTGWHILYPMAICCNWSPDQSRAALDIAFPVGEIRLVEMAPGLPTQQALAPVRTRAEYLRTNWGLFHDWVENPETPVSQAVQILGNLSELAMNQYDSGEYEESLWTFKHLDELCRARFNRADPNILTLLRGEEPTVQGAGNL